MKTAVLINVGTPDSPQPEDVGRYLREFLMDENILTIPRPFRDILVKGIIVPRRKYTSAKKYQSIWTTEGSPLMVESVALQKSLQNKLGSEWHVELGMQVGNPSLKSLVSKLDEKNETVVFIPLYPQFATATTGGALQAIEKAPSSLKNVKVIQAFYNKSWFVDSLVKSIKPYLESQDHLLLSYHGLPVSQLTDHRKACDSSAACCQMPDACAQNCYKAQCLKTTSLLQDKLNHDKISTGFQSRLGRGRWIEPSTQSQMQKLVSQNVKHLKVACPSFVSDCLETLEEIGQELREEFLHLGGESFTLIPCVNSSESFVSGLAEEIRSIAQGY